MTISQPRTSRRKKNPVLTSMQWDEVIEAITEARDLMGGYMSSISAESDPDDWARLSAEFAKYHRLLKEIKVMREKR